MTDGACQRGGFLIKFGEGKSMSWTNTGPAGPYDQNLRYCANGHVLPVQAVTCPICGQPQAISQPGPGSQPNPSFGMPAQQYPNPNPTPPKSKTPIIIISVVGGVVALGFIGLVSLVLLGGLLASSATTTVGVEIQVTSTEGSDETGDCIDGLDWYGDIHDGAQVKILGDQGQVLGVGNLAADVTEYASNICNYTATVPDVSTNEDFYALNVGRDGRGDLTYTRSEMESNGWVISGTLGG